MADADFLSVVLLLNCNGSNDSTTFTDISASAKTVTAVGDAKIKTAQSKFGGASAYFDGTGDYLTVDSSDAFALGTNDFTVEWWAYQLEEKIVSWIDFRAGTASSPRLMTFNDSGSRNIILYVSGANRITSADNVIAFNQWQHMAVCRASGSTRLFVDGTQVGSTWSDSTNYTAAALRIGGNTCVSTRNFNGYLDDIRITNGVGRYTANFTPPTAEFSRPNFGVSGVITDENGDPCQRTVYVIDRASGALLGTTESDSGTGEYSVEGFLTDDEVARIVIAEGATLRNDLIDRIIPGEM